MKRRIQEPRTAQRIPDRELRSKGTGTYDVPRSTRWVARFVVQFMVLLCLLLPAGTAAQERETPLIIPAGQTYAGDLATITRDIRVEGEVTGDVTSWSGAIVISGRVGGDVVSYSGHVTIQAGARIGGHILASGDGLRLDTTAAVTGQTIRSESGGMALANLLDLFSPDGTGNGEAAVGRALFGATLGVFLLAFALLCIAFWPRRTAATSLTLRQTPGRALALGLLTTLLLALLLPPLAALLAATLVGLPLLIVLLTLIQAPYVYGLATLARAAGVAGRLPTRSPSGRDGQFQPAHATAGPAGTALNRTTLLLAAALALLVAIGTALAPLWGLMLFYLLASPGLGAALLSRGGLLAPAYE
jgi:cytoskeletal protein CcmA (bactofilin family)